MKEFVERRTKADRAAIASRYPLIAKSDLREVARIVVRSMSWVRRNGHKLPGFSQPDGKGCKVSWSRRALTEWIAGETFPLTGARKRA